MIICRRERTLESHLPIIIAGKAVGAVVSALRSVSVTEEQVAGAKKQLLSDVYTLMEDPLQLVENMGVQVRVLSLLADTSASSSVILYMATNVCTWNSS